MLSLIIIFILYLLFCILQVFANSIPKFELNDKEFNFSVEDIKINTELKYIQIYVNTVIKKFYTYLDLLQNVESNSLINDNDTIASMFYLILGQSYIFSLQLKNYLIQTNISINRFILFFLVLVSFVLIYYLVNKIYKLLFSIKDFTYDYDNCVELINSDIDIYLEDTDISESALLDLYYDCKKYIIYDYIPIFLQLNVSKEKIIDFEIMQRHYWYLMKIDTVSLIQKYIRKIFYFLTGIVYVLLFLNFNDIGLR